MKACKTCLQVKPLDEYPKHSKTNLKLKPSCQACYKEKRRLRYAADIENQRAIKRKSYQKLYGGPDGSARWREKHLYKLPEGSYKRMFEAQNGLCACCALKYESLVIDHCHATGKVRGLLCQNCNLAIGHIKDSPERAKQLVAYLEVTQCF